MEVYETLENDFGVWLGQENCVACSSGTAAVHLAIEAMNFPLGSEIICPDFTMVACARAITLAGHKPIFVDCLDDLNIDANLIEKAISKKTVAILAVHIYGRFCDLPKIWGIANTHGLLVIEDCAECPTPFADSQSSAHTYSFYRNKPICGQEGGMIAFKRAEDANKARQLRSLGFTEAHDFQHIPRGCNYRLANALASLIIPSLREMSKNLEKRRQVEAWYDEMIPAEWRMPQRDVVWVYDLCLPSGTLLNPLIKQLNQDGIAARHSFKVMSMQEEYLNHDEGFTKSSPNARRLSQEVIYLPVTPDMTKSHVTWITDRLLSLMK